MVCISLLIGCAGLSAVLIINQGAKASYAEPSSNRLLPLNHQIIASSPNHSISASDYAEIKALGMSQAVAVLEHSAHVYLEGERISQRQVELIGIDFLSLLNQASVQSYDETSASPESTQKATTANIDAIDLAPSFGFTAPTSLIHPKFLQELRLKQSNLLSLSAEHRSTLPPMQSIELAGLANTIVMDIGSLQQLLSHDTEPMSSQGKPHLLISRILILQGSTQSRIQALKTWLPPHLTLEEIDSFEGDNNTQPQMTESFYLNLFAMALLMFAVCLFIVLNAFNLLLSKRFAMLKVLRQLGVSRKHIMLAHAGEFFVISAGIAGAGVAIGTQLALFASPSIRNIIGGLYGVQLGFAELTLSGLYVKVLLISLAGVSLALVTPFKQLNQYLSNTQHPEVSEKLNRILIACALLFATVSIVIFSVSVQLALLLLGAALVILGGCCILLVCFPIILRFIHSLIPETFTLVRLSMAQAVSLSRKTKVACCAFFIAATSNLGMNLMVDSFRDSTESWLSQRLVAEYYLYSNDADKNTHLTLIAEQTGVELYPRYEQNIRFNNQDVQLFSYPLRQEFQLAMVFEKQIDNVWDAFSMGDKVFINQQFAIRNSLDITDQISIKHPLSQQTEKVTIAGIIYDYGNPKGQILLPTTAFIPMNQDASIFAILASQQQIQHFKDAIKDIGIDPESQIFETQALLSGSMEVFDRTFVITDSLNFVTLLVAALSLACTIVILLEQSRPQSILLRAMGVTAWQSRRLLLQQYVFLCVVALLAATPFGILLSYILIEQINYHAFNWSYPLVIDYVSILQLFGVSILVVVVIISLPILHTTKQSLAQELKCLD